METKDFEKHLRYYSTSLVIREIQIKATLRFYQMPMKIYTISKTNDSMCWGEYGVQRLIINGWGGYKAVSHYGYHCDGSSENSKQVYVKFQKYHSLTYNSKENISYCRDTSSTMLIAILLITGRNWKQPRYPSREE
jgi:hypothetical protein